MLIFFFATKYYTMCQGYRLLFILKSF